MMESSRSGFFLRSRAQNAASSMLQRASEKLATSQPELSNRLNTARERLQQQGVRARQTDILGRDVEKAKARELKAASVYSEDHVVLFPGHACIRASEKGDDEVVVEVSGFAYRTRPLERASRSQKLFVAAAQRLAGLSKVPAKEPATATELEGIDLVQGNAATKQDAFEQLLALGEKAKLVDDDDMGIEDLEELTKEPTEVHMPERAASSSSSLPSVRSSSSLSSLPAPPKHSSRQTARTTSKPRDDVPHLQANLRNRLRAFFAQKLEGRHVRVEVGLADEGHGRTLAKGSLLSGEGGGFRHLITFPATSIQRGDRLMVSVELLASPHADAPSVEGEHQREDSCLVQIARQDSVHIISDLDDTCKHSQVLAGARTLIRNVFARDLADLTVPGMQSLYDAMHRHGAGASFHYVSNSPWELAPVVKEFLAVAGLPMGQIVLKQYASGTGLMGNLWEPAGQRKRTNLESVLQAFPTAPFVMIGDSGEQDLETYVSLAQQYPDQIKAIYIRDVTTPFALAATELRRDGSQTPRSTRPPVSRRAQTADPAEFARRGLADLALDMVDEHSDALSPNNPPRPEVAGVSDQKRRLLETFYHRVASAERALPRGVHFRLFQSGDDIHEEVLALLRSLSP